MITLKSSSFLGVHSTTKSSNVEFGRRMTMLTGFNGSGKSTFLLGIFLALDGLHERQDRALLTPRKNWGIELNLVDEDVKLNSKGRFNNIIHKMKINLTFRLLILEMQDAGSIKKVSEVFGNQMSDTFEKSFKDTINICKIKNTAKREENVYSTYISKERVKENTEVFAFKVTVDNSNTNNRDILEEYGNQLKDNDREISAVLYQDEKFYYTNDIKGIDGLKNLDVFTQNNNLDKSIYFLLDEFRKKVLNIKSDLSKVLSTELEKNIKLIGDKKKLEKLIEDVISSNRFDSKVNNFLKEANEFFKDINKELCISNSGDLYFVEHYGKSNHKIINWYDCSKGEKNLLSLLLMTFIYKDSNTIFILDEPDLAMHIKWQNMLLDSFLKIAPDSQFIVSTHSPALIPKIKDEIGFVNITKLKNAMESNNE